MQVIIFGTLAILGHGALILWLVSDVGQIQAAAPGGMENVTIRSTRGVEAMVARWDARPSVVDTVSSGETPTTSQAPVQIPEILAGAPGLVASPVAVGAPSADAVPEAPGPLPPRLVPELLISNPSLSAPEFVQSVALSKPQRAASRPNTGRRADSALSAALIDPLPETPASLVPARAASPPPPRPGSLRVPATQEEMLAAWGGAIQTQIDGGKIPPPGRWVPGYALIRVVVTGGGEVLSADLVRSAGDPQLDDAALLAVRRAGRMPPAPDGADIATATFDVPVIFTR